MNILEGETALQNRKTELLVVSAHARVQSLSVFKSGSLNFFKPVALVGGSNNPQQVIPTLFIAGWKISHSTRRAHSHEPILSLSVGIAGSQAGGRRFRCAHLRFTLSGCPAQCRLGVQPFLRSHCDNSQ